MSGWKPAFLACGITLCACGCAPSAGGPGGPRVETVARFPSGLVPDSGITSLTGVDGAVSDGQGGWIVAKGGEIRQGTADGQVRTLMPGRELDYAEMTRAVTRRAPDQPRTYGDVARGPDGTIYAAAIEEPPRIFKLAPGGSPAPFAVLEARGPASEAEMTLSVRLAMAPRGGLVALDPQYRTLQRFTPDGRRTAIACEDAAGRPTALNRPRALAVDAAGNAYVADMVAGKAGLHLVIYKAAPGGPARPLPADLEAEGPSAVHPKWGPATAKANTEPFRMVALGPDDLAYFQESGVGDPLGGIAMWRLPPSGVATYVMGGPAGTTEPVDGSGEDVRFAVHGSAALGSDGALYYLDEHQGRHETVVRRITL